jgi:hypothetical protein
VNTDSELLLVSVPTITQYALLNFQLFSKVFIARSRVLSLMCSRPFMFDDGNPPNERIESNQVGPRRLDPLLHSQ